MRMKNLAQLILTLWLFSCATSTHAQWQTRLPNPLPAANARFGDAIAVDGSRLFVGAPLEDAGAGAVYVYELQNDVYVQTTRLIANDRASGDNFGNSVAIDGNVAVIGAWKDNLPAGSGAGSAYVFEPNNGAWTQRTKLVAPDGATGDGFGIAVDVSGDQLVVGAWADTVAGVGQNAGSAHVFSRSGNSWLPTAQLFADGASSFDRFGSAVAISGNNLIIGARNADGDAGAAYAFRLSGGVINFQSKLVSNDRGASDAFGSAIALEGDLALIGAKQHADAAGAAYFYGRVAGVWTQQAKLVSPSPQAGDEFGAALDLKGGIVAIGAPRAPGGIFCCLQHGSVSLFQRTGSQWSVRRRLLASDGADFDQMGSSVAIAVDGVFAGAPLSNGTTALDAGSVVQFKEPLSVFRDGFE